MTVSRSISSLDIILLSPIDLYISRIRHQLYIPHIGAACSIQMSLRKSDNNAVRIVVSRTPVPTFMNIIRTGLYCTERNTSSDKYMPMTSRTYIRVNSAIKLFYGSFLLFTRKKDRTGKCSSEQHFCFHVQLFLFLIYSYCNVLYMQTPFTRLQKQR